jgi:RHS repeat-associated protein
MLVPGRHYNSEKYRFAFQGQEKDDEIKGSTGTSYAYKFRMHDPRTGRFWSVDPLTKKYPYNSPYAFSENQVINAVELEGLEKSTAIMWNKIGKEIDAIGNSFSKMFESSDSKTLQDEKPETLADRNINNESDFTWTYDTNISGLSIYEYFVEDAEIPTTTTSSGNELNNASPIGIGNIPFLISGTAVAADQIGLKYTSKFNVMKFDEVTNWYINSKTWQVQDEISLPSIYKSGIKLKKYGNFFGARTGHSPGGLALTGMSIAYDGYLFSNNYIGGERFTYRSIGNISSYGVGYFAGGGPGLLTGGLFMSGELYYDVVIKDVMFNGIIETERRLNYNFKKNPFKTIRGLKTGYW